MAKRFITPYGVGDVVQVVKGEFRKYRSGKEPQIIENVCVRGLNDYEYATLCYAWVDHKDIELIRKADRASMKILLEEREGE